MTGDQLFDPGPPLPRPADEWEQLSIGARRTVRQRQLLAEGIHPATRLPLLDEGGHTCGDCQLHRTIVWTKNRTFHKCERHRLGLSHSAASDIRVGWPACTAFECPTRPAQ